MNLLLPCRRVGLALLLSGCVGTTWVGDKSDCGAPAGEAMRQDWTKDTWRNTYYTLQVSGEGDRLTFVVSRPRHASARWGEKPAARMEGLVSRISGCLIELEGQYVQSERAVHIGRVYRYHARQEGRDMLVGKMYGAGREWIDMAFTREPLPPARLMRTPDD